VERGPKDACWNWAGCITSGGYGSLIYQGQSTVAHRVAYMLTNGGITLSTSYRVPGAAAKYKKFVLHHCDNRRCCNPSHLYLGTLTDNMHDAYDRGRKAQPTGQHHANAKLTNVQAEQVRSMYQPGVTRQVDIAKMFGVSQVAISKILRRETY
jgi:hypothetical protein